MSPLWLAIIGLLSFSSFVDGQKYCGKFLVHRTFASQGVCCENKWAWVGVRNGACCGSRGYAPSGQICCGGKVSSKDSILSGCCYGKPYERNQQHCCGRELIDIATHGCCRNEPFNKAFEECCEGERVPNLYDDDVPRECCGKELYNKETDMCCAKKVVKKIAGEHTKCCITNPYDERRDACCNKKIIPKIPGRSECCHGRMIDPRKEFCCDFKIQKRKFGKSTGCCRLGLWKYTMYNTDSHICCARELRPRFTKYARRHEREEAKKRISCCNQAAYDTKHEICCGLRVHKRKNRAERCCGSRTYDRSRYICCDGRKYRFNRKKLVEQRGNTYCCGKRKYDRRRAQCILAKKNYKIVSLNWKKPKTPNKSNKIPSIEIFLAGTTSKPFKPEVFTLPTVDPDFDPFGAWNKKTTSRPKILSKKSDPFVLPTFDPNGGLDPFEAWKNSKKTTLRPNTTPNPFVLPNLGTLDPFEAWANKKTTHSPNTTPNPFALPNLGTLDPFEAWANKKTTHSLNTTPNPFVLPNLGTLDPFEAWANKKTTRSPNTTPNPFVLPDFGKLDPFAEWSNKETSIKTTRPSRFIAPNYLKEIAKNANKDKTHSLLELDLLKELDRFEGKNARG